jgi:hypothetical protein
MNSTEISLPNAVSDELAQALVDEGFEVASSGTGFVDWVKEGDQTPEQLKTLRDKLTDAFFEAFPLSYGEEDDYEDEDDPRDVQRWGEIGAPIIGPLDEG